jgi:tetratricopeptide (TPR) repeat protein/Tol biopolymer transport system component
LATITIDYPLEGSIFPPEITPPTFIWHDAAEDITRWRVEVAFGDGSPSIQVESRGEPMRIGEIDSRCIAKTNELPKLTPEQALAHTWTPDARTWEAIKSHSAVAPAAVTITGFREDQPPAALSHGRVAIQTSKDQVGAPIFYRDVPLMPFESKKGDIQPLAPQVIRLVQWQLRYIGEPRGRVVLKNLPTCGNCHSFSLDGKTMGMDVDGPQNSKGLYALVSVKPETTIRTADIVPWGVSHDNKGTPLGRVGFMSQVSPDGKHVVTTVQPAGRSRESNYYVINFKDYRFLQVFYPARGILAWYSRESGERRPLPGADDPRYVQTDGVWSPDGQYLVFARAEARDPNPPDGKLAEYANDPKELQIQYDLYRIPFNGGQGGQPEPIAGASRNGMSNTFPKVSPDGCWIVFVKCRNGQLMRPDSQLYIVPAQGGQARRMRCNTSLMNSWHSFSPNGRWMVFSSKSRSPYTQMFLTHIDEEGNDSPAILIDNSTAANRAVNLPEFVNIPPDGLTQISVPAVDMFYKFDHARELQAKGEFDAAIREWSELVQEDPSDHRFHNNLALSLVALGRNDEAIPEYKRAIELFPYSADTYCNLGLALAAKDRLDEATAAFEKSVQMNPNLLEAQYNLGVLLARQGQLEKALPHFQKAVEINSNSAEAQYDLAIALVSRGELAQALLHFAKTVEIKPEFTDAHYNLGNLLYAQARVQEALAQWREVLRLDPNYAPAMIQAAYALAASPEASDRNGAEAVKLAERALQLTGTDNPLYLDTLAAAYAEAGRFPEAIEAARKALELAKQHNQDELARTLNAKIGLYEARKPYRLTMEDSP